MEPYHELIPLLKQATYDSKVTFDLASYDVREIRDDHFTGEQLESVIIAPVVRFADTNLKKTFVFLRAVFGGCIWSMILPKLVPTPESFLAPSAIRSSLEPVYMEEDPELLNLIISTLEKQQRGEVSHKLKT